MKNIYYTLIFTILFIQNINSQNSYLPPHRANVSLERYEKNINDILRFRRNLADGELKTIGDTSLCFYGISVTYANLFEPNDSIFHYLDKAMIMDSFMICRALLFRDSLVTSNKKARPIFDVDSTKFNDYKQKCQICIEVELAKRAIKKKKALEEEGINLALVTQLKEMMKRDQLYRVQMNKASNNNEVDSLWVLQNKVDTENEVLLDSIFNRFGYPDKKLVSEFNQLTAGIILLHMSPVFQKRYLSMMIASYKAGSVDATSLMMLLDKIYITDTGKQLFGTQSNINGSRLVYFNQEEAYRILKELGLEELNKKLRTE